MTIKSFAELTQQVHILNDLILSDMTTGKGDYAEEVLNFSRRLFTTKYWYARTSWANKRRYVLVLMTDLRSAWALSLLLKSLWNCRPKDAVLSANAIKPWSSYDQIPMDHNRTAQPVKVLGQVMTTDRKWFHTLEPEFQAIVLMELLMIAGGPLMWEVLRRGQLIYERHHEAQLRDLLECIVVDQPTTVNDTKKSMYVSNDIKKAGSNRSAILLNMIAQTQGKAQKELDASLAAWNNVIKSIKDSQKLEEVEMTFKDGSKKKIWKVNRIKPEATETVDFLQLLPSYVGKRILSFLPQNSLAECSKVNRYWAYLVEEMRAETLMRVKLETDMGKLQEVMLRHDTSLEVLQQPGVSMNVTSTGGTSITPSTRQGGRATSFRPSERSAGGLSFRYLVVDKLKPAHKIKQKPLKRMADLDDRLEQRGAADENLWVWCENVLKYVKGPRRFKAKIAQEGVIMFPELHFPCPMMKHSLELPLATPLYRDPAQTTSGLPKLRRCTSEGSFLKLLKYEPSVKRFSLWSRNFSSLYKVFKVASYEFAV